MTVLTRHDDLSRSYPAVPESVPMARRALVEFAEAHGVDEDRIDSLRLAASEAITNAVRHAYDDDRGFVHVSAAVASGELWVLIADDGRGLTPHSRHRGLGLGLALIASVTDHMTVVRRSAGGTELRMRFGTGGAAVATLRQDTQVRGSVASARSAA